MQYQQQNPNKNNNKTLTNTQNVETMVNHYHNYNVSLICSSPVVNSIQDIKQHLKYIRLLIYDLTLICTVEFDNQVFTLICKHNIYI